MNASESAYAVDLFNRTSACATVQLRCRLSNCRVLEPAMAHSHAFRVRSNYSGVLSESTCSMAEWSVNAYGKYSRAFDHDLGVGARRARALQVGVKRQADAFVSGPRHSGVAPHRV